jgi:hypothetical protein
MTEKRISEQRLRDAIRRADWMSLRRDFVKARVLVTVLVLLALAIVFFASEPRREIGLVQGRVTGFSQGDTEWPNTSRLITVRLDDGRVVVARVRGGFLAPDNERVTLREIERGSWWRRRTFVFLSAEAIIGDAS